MKKVILLLSLVITIISCDNSNEAKGYYSGSFQKGKDYQEYGGNRLYYRINGDTVVEMTVAVGETKVELAQDMKIDSTRYVWNGKYYEDIYNEGIWNIPIKMDDSTSVLIGSFKYGDTKYRIIEGDKITFQFDSTKFIQDDHVRVNRDGFRFDILKPVEKLYIVNSLQKEKTKDSLAFFNPTVTQERLHESILDFLEMRFEEDLYGDIIYSSIETQDLESGKFFVKFRTRDKFNRSIERQNIYLFDFTLAGFGIQRVN